MGGSPHIKVRKDQTEIRKGNKSNFRDGIVERLCRFTFMGFSLTGICVYVTGHKNFYNIILRRLWGAVNRLRTQMIFIKDRKSDRCLFNWQPLSQRTQL